MRVTQNYLFINLKTNLFNNLGAHLVFIMTNCIDYIIIVYLIDSLYYI